VTMPALVGPVLGPLVGGFLVTYATWHWIFWINVPFGIIAIILAMLVIDEVREPEVPPLDMIGFLLCGIGIAAVVFGLENVSDGILSPVASLTLAGLGSLLLTGYVYRALAMPHPIIDIRLLKVSTFRASVVGGTLFRIGVGALPFLLPLLLQIGFGKNALESGAVTFAAAAGALVMKAGVAQILNRWGFRKVMIYNAVLSGLSMAACALFSPATPYWVMIFVLLVGGLFRSLQFTAINTVAFADLPSHSLSNATSFTSMTQQLALSIGIAVGAALLQIASLEGDGPLETSDFAFAFLFVGLLSASSAVLFARLHRDAGAEMSGRAIQVSGSGGATAPAVAAIRRAQGAVDDE